MTRDEQLDWAQAHMVRDPYWADTEFSIRRKALEIHAQVLKEGSVDISLYRMRPDTFYAQDRLHFHRLQFERIGGVEQVLLIEEVLRRAMT